MKPSHDNIGVVLKVERGDLLELVIREHYAFHNELVIIAIVVERLGRPSWFSEVFTMQDSSSRIDLQHRGQASLSPLTPRSAQLISDIGWSRIWVVRG